MKAEKFEVMLKNNENNKIDTDEYLETLRLIGDLVNIETFQIQNRKNASETRLAIEARREIEIEEIFEILKNRRSFISVICGEEIFSNEPNEKVVDIKAIIPDILELLTTTLGSDVVIVSSEEGECIVFNEKRGAET